MADIVVDITRATDPARLSTAAAAVPDGVLSARFIGPSRSLLDYITGGLGTIAGVVSIYEGDPAYSRVRLVRDRDGLLVRQTWTDPVTGQFEFAYIETDFTYTIIAYDPTGTYPTIITDGIEFYDDDVELVFGIPTGTGVPEIEEAPMQNMRMISDNSALRAALTADSEASAAMAVEYMQTDVKTDVYRSVGTSVTIEAEWAVAEPIGGVAFAFCNWTPTATIRVRGYALTADVVPLFDTGVIDACPASPLGLWEWGSKRLGSNAFSYGGGTYGRSWMEDPGVVERLVIDIEDPDNEDGYLEMGCMICGDYWSPQINADWGAPVTPVSTSKHYRTDAGNLRTDVGCRYRKQTVNLTKMGAVDRATMWDIVWGSGMELPIFFSLYPNHEDPLLEQTHQMYCKLSTLSSYTTPYFQRFATSLDLEEL